jgi:4-hydroxybenzoate polyprenyltransferase
VAGFDCFYALLDLDVDREQGLQSVAVRFGGRGAFVPPGSVTSARSRCSSPPGLGLTVASGTGSASPSVAGLLAYEHSLVRPGDLRRLDTAFSTMNGVISVAFSSSCCWTSCDPRGGLEKDYGEKRVLRGLDFELEARRLPSS